jgi:hypothetical protein
MTDAQAVSRGHEVKTGLGSPHQGMEVKNFQQKKIQQDVRSEFKYDIFDALMHCKNFCKCHTVPPPSTTTKKKKRSKEKKDKK